MKALAAAANPQLIEIIDAAKDPGLLADRVVAGLDVDRTREIEMLHTSDVAARLRLCATLIAEARARFELKQKIGDEVRRELGKDQREAMLRQQLRAIQKELGEEPRSDELATLRERLDKAELPEEIRSVADRELRRIEGMNSAQAEYNVIRTYLEWIADLPWSVRAEAEIDLDAVVRRGEQVGLGAFDAATRAPTLASIFKMMGEIVPLILKLSLPILGMVFVVGIFSNVLQTGFFLAFKVVLPKFDKINPVNGLKGMFKLKKIIELNQAGVNSAFFEPGPYTPMEDDAARYIEWYLDTMRQV